MTERNFLNLPIISNEYELQGGFRKVYFFTGLLEISAQVLVTKMSFKQENYLNHMPQ